MCRCARGLGWGAVLFHGDWGVVDLAGLDGEYWFRNLREPVLFEPVVRSLLGEGSRAFVEVGPHPVLTVGVGEIVDAVVEGGGMSR